MREVIRRAVLEQRCLVLIYEPGPRIIEPHAYGYGSDGQILLRAYQIEGASASGEHEHWKLFRDDRIINVSLHGTTFEGPREGYKENDKAMKRGIIAQLLLHNRTAQEG